MDFSLTKEQQELKATYEAFFREAMKQAPPEYLKGGLIMSAAAASESKVFGSELNKRIIALATEIMGLYGMVESSRWAPMGETVDLHQMAPALTMAAGSNEIQRSIITWIGLKQPGYKLR